MKTVHILNCLDFMPFLGKGFKTSLCSFALAPSIVSFVLCPPPYICYTVYNRIFNPRALNFYKQNSKFCWFYFFLEKTSEIIK